MTMLLQIVFIAIIAIVSWLYIYFCYRRFKQQKIIEWWLPNKKLRMFWVIICLLLGIIIWGILYALSWLFNASESEKTIINEQPKSPTNTQNTWNNWADWTTFAWSWAILSWWVEDTWEIVSRTTIREKLKHVPVTEKRWTSAQ